MQRAPVWFYSVERFEFGGSDIHSHGEHVCEWHVYFTVFIIIAKIQLAFHLCELHMIKEAKEAFIHFNSIFQSYGELGIF